MRAYYAACSSRKQDRAGLRGWNGFFAIFCAVRKMGLGCKSASNLTTSGNINDRQGTSDFIFKHIGRFEDAKLRKALL